MIGVIGCGNMSNAIVRGIHKVFPNEQFLTYTPSFTRADELAKAVQGKAVKELNELSSVETLIIACKPQQFDDLITSFNKAFPLNEKHIISIMAAIPMATISKKLEAKKITRVMPNTPALVGEGISLLLHSEEVSSEEKERVTKYFEACSSVYTLESEKQFDEVTTISGSGPAYVFLFAKSLVDKALKLGLEEDAAKKMVAELIMGSAELIHTSGNKTLDTLVSEVTSKGGVTIEAVNVYKEQGLIQTTDHAIDAAIKRSVEITEQFS